MTDIGGYPWLIRGTSGSLPPRFGSLTDLGLFCGVQATNRQLLRNMHRVVDQVQEVICPRSLVSPEIR
jgi:hypothetical protein